MISNRVNNHRFYTLTSGLKRAATNHDGSVLRINDYGWRNTAYPVVKARVGKFYIGRWFHMTWGAKPSAVKDINDVFLQNTGVLRFMTTKIRSPYKFYKPRSSFYLTPEAYPQISSSEVRQGPVDFSL